MSRFIRRTVRVLAVSTVGTVLLLLGLIMLVTPGPGLLLIALSIVVFSLEFAWAGRLRDRARTWLAGAVPERHQPWLRRAGLLEAAGQEPQDEPDAEPDPGRRRSHHRGSGPGARAA